MKNWKSIVRRVDTNLNKVAYLIETRDGNSEIIPLSEVLKTRHGSYLANTFEGENHSFTLTDHLFSFFTKQT